MTLNYFNWNSPHHLFPVVVQFFHSFFFFQDRWDIIFFLHNQMLFIGGLQNYQSLCSRFLFIRVSIWDWLPSAWNSSCSISFSESLLVVYSLGFCEFKNDFLSLSYLNSCMKFSIASYFISAHWRYHSDFHCGCWEVCGLSNCSFFVIDLYLSQALCTFTLM